MLYTMYQAQTDALNMARLLTAPAAQWLDLAWAGRDGLYAARKFAAAMDVFTRAGTTHRRPDFAIAPVLVGNRETEVRETVALRLPFADMLHFEKDIKEQQPRVLVVA